MAGEGARSSLRFLTCGSVDDGKSTLIGRLLFEAGKIFDDQLAALAADSRKVGTRGGEIDYALLLDGLEAERTQGITIDVAYRYFSTDKRRFIVADAPGHEQYTRNMATAASTADVAVVLVDVRNGVRRQTRRHSSIVALMGIRRAVLAVNKMDLAGYDEGAFAAVAAAYREVARELGLDEVTVIPMSATEGDNVVSRSSRMPWYRGPSLLEYLEDVQAGDEPQGDPFRMPVQWTSRPDAAFRGFAGPVVSGSVAPGMAVRILPSGRDSRVERIVTAGGDLARAGFGQAITLTLADEVDVARGDVICEARAPAECADRFEATLVWFAEAHMPPGRTYLMKIGAKTAVATVTPLKYRIDVESFEHAAASHLEQNDIGVVQLQLDQRIAFEPYAKNRDLGGFILIDRISNETVGAGMLRFALRRSTNVHWQAIDLDRNARAAMKHQKPCVLWFTGIPAAGKSTIANAVERKLHSLGRHTYLLDGDNVRHGLNKDLGFTEEARVENIRRVAEVAALMADAGLITLVAFISPFRSERRMARALLPEGQFLEVFVDTPLAAAEARDPKGLYRKARAGAIKNFTGIDSPYEVPENPEIRIDTMALSPEAAAEHIVERMLHLGL